MQLQSSEPRERTHPFLKACCISARRVVKQRVSSGGLSPLAVMAFRSAGAGEKYWFAISVADDVAPVQVKSPTTQAAKTRHKHLHPRHGASLHPSCAVYFDGQDRGQKHLF